MHIDILLSHDLFFRLYILVLHARTPDFLRVLHYIRSTKRLLQTNLP